MDSRGIRERVPDRSTGSVPARSGSEASVAVDVSFAPVSAATRVSEALQDDDDAVPARRELSDAEAWRLAADGHAPAAWYLVCQPRLMHAFASLCELPLISYFVQHAA